MTMSVQAEAHQHDLENATIEDKMAALAQGASLLAKVPVRNKTFVPFGDYDMLEQVIESRQFFPVYITGLSGNGKTFQVEQACAKLGREYVRANITLETDEDDLLGGFRLRDGNTVFEPGPAIVAMLRGAVLLLDEVDLASPKLLCLQPIMEGKAITLKKLGVTISPAPGFTVIATANTKGRGDETGNFIGAGLLNEAFLERFPITVEQEYPSISVEKKILAKHFEAAGFAMTPHSVTFFDTLARWAEAIRTTFAEGGIDSPMSTRRLCHIVRAYAIFGGDDAKALGYCVNRFDAKTKEAFTDLYNKLAPDAAGTPSNTGSLDGDSVNAPAF
ncbi:MAG: AAA family ATPase [Patescibacteria group bacterium]|nr:AAA family ATPase [Patescibacteria group bacterium]